jgi:hypothetical protein
MESDYLMEKKVEVQLDLFTTKLMNELKAIKDELKSTQDQLRMINKTISTSHGEATIPSSQGARQDFQVNLPRNAPSGQYAPEGYAPQQQQPQQQYGYQQQGYPQQPPQYQQPQQPARQQFQQPNPQPVQMDQNQGGFTGASVAQNSRGRGTNLPPNLSMDKVFYCGGKR